MEKKYFLKLKIQQNLNLLMTCQIKVAQRSKTLQERRKVSIFPKISIMVDSHLMFLQIQLENLTYKVFSKSKNQSTSKVQLKTIRNRYERIMVKILKMNRKSLFLSIGTLDKKIKSLRCHLTRFTLMRVIINFLLLLILYSLRGAFINKNF